MDIDNIQFKKRVSIEQIEESKDICPKFDKVGLLPCITIESETKMILMFSFINEEAFKKTILSKKGHYFSRSRDNVWKKGEPKQSKVDGPVSCECMRVQDHPRIINTTQ